MSLKEFYNNRYSKDYREKLNGYEIARWEALFDVIKKYVKEPGNKKVLDYGCGSGLYVDLWKLFFNDENLVFCDISSKALGILSQKYPEFKEKVSEIQKDKTLFDDNSIDLIVSIEVIEHVESFEKYIKEIYRILKPGGIFIWTTPCANILSVEHIYNIFTDNIEKTEEGYRRWKWEDKGHLRRFKSKEIKKLLNKKGFNKVNFRYRAHFFSFLCTRYLMKKHKKLAEKLMLLDYKLFRVFPNAASMIGIAIKK
ncbi:MAG: methyltransferase domain-containing protein [Candidatus Muiribacteriota bacterium]